MDQGVRASGLHKIYGSRGARYPALRGIDIYLRPGEFLGVMGPSGSGKTTLLNMLGGIDSPSQGKILFDGRDLSSLEPRELAAFRRDKLGFIFQDFNLLDTLTVFENIVLPLSLASVRGSEQRERGRKAAESLGLSDILDKYPSEISGGQKQRAAAARAFVSNPSLILADEPTGNLDSRASGELLSSLEKLNKENKAAIVLVTHDAFAASFCRRIIFLRDGLVFGEIVKGNGRKEFFDRIIDTLRKLEGGDDESL